MPDLTARQAQLLAWMQARRGRTFLPLVLTGCVGSSVADLEALEARGLVARHPGQPARWSATPEDPAHD